GAAVDLRSVNWTLGLILAAIGIVGKVVAGFAVWRRGVKRTIVGVGMIPRGEVGLIFAQIGLTSRLLNAGLYSAVALMVILTTLITPPLLRVLLERSAREAVHSEAADLVMDAPSDGERRRNDRRAIT
ncbi:MAG TPA: cation:proton antiporter, partial [Thermoanaerobaculia bacterium]|nr:cation:proton antiporter [Thermoanaerobaculia bacterium]